MVVLPARNAARIRSRGTSAASSPISPLIVATAMARSSFCRSGVRA